MWICTKKVVASRAKNLSISSTLFLISRVKKIFIKLRQVFIETPIQNQFNLKHYILIETNVLGYTIGRIFS